MAGNVGVRADEAPATPATPDPRSEEGLDLMQRGAQMLLRSLLDQIGPKMDDMRNGMDQALREMGPALTELMGKIDDIRNYDPPVMLPNGDIIIRRKPPADQTRPDGSGQIEL